MNSLKGILYSNMNKGFLILLALIIFVEANAEGNIGAMGGTDNGPTGYCNPSVGYRGQSLVDHNTGQWCSPTYAVEQGWTQYSYPCNINKLEVINDGKSIFKRNPYYRLAGFEGCYVWTGEVVKMPIGN